MSGKLTVFIAGATGYTGSVIAKHLLSTGNFSVIALIRASSASKPIVNELESAGAEIRLGDLSDPVEKLEKALTGVDVVISTVLAMVDQRPLLLAASKVGVKRVVPSDFGPHAPRGAMYMNDIKLDVRDYVKSLSLPYTFIEVGWWTREAFPFPHASKEAWNTPKHFTGTGDVPVLLTSMESIATFVGLIIVDERTLNQTVIIHDVEYTMNEVRKLAEKITGEDFSDYPTLSNETLQEKMQSDEPFTKIIAEYQNSLYVRGDNTLAKSKADGLLVARELYQGVPVPSFEEEGRTFYAKPFVWGESEL
ncbi:NAD-P-binding protein [Cylindrobasidium torrendii FP15055 ss-10]|uniref:NAD-P-binding protein n=1 Tax=Cylindrobasidium torrendii FP15055 ss-10 TaxID=1314674 RepID=A0A0D7BAE0_9AGAR|nr:NAD-P-binding protein [Cylindrobasidium torrendii FP15055 ss-10]